MAGIHGWQPGLDNRVLLFMYSAPYIPVLNFCGKRIFLAFKFPFNIASVIQSCWSRDFTLPGGQA